MSDLPERITARIDYDGEWDGQWCEIDREPIGIHAYHHAEYVRADRIEALEADLAAAQARADALAEKLEKAVGALKLANSRLVWAAGLIRNDTARDIAAGHADEARATLDQINGEDA